MRISVPECGIDGDADLLAIEPCPPIEPGEGRVVTGTFKHSSAHVVELRLAGVDDSIITTTNHLFWSEDRQEFVRADGLRANEHLRGRDCAGACRQRHTTSRHAQVYNLEVHLDHVFHVGSAGVLVHNGGAGLVILDNCPFFFNGGVGFLVPDTAPMDDDLGALGSVLTRPSSPVDQQPRTNMRNWVDFDDWDWATNQLIDRKWNVTGLPKSLDRRKPGGIRPTWSHCPLGGSEEQGRPRRRL